MRRRKWIDRKRLMAMVRTQINMNVICNRAVTPNGQAGWLIWLIVAGYDRDAIGKVPNVKY